MRLPCVALRFGFSWVMIRPSGRVRMVSKTRGSSRVRSGQVGSGRVGSGRVGSGRVGSGRVGSGRVESVQEIFKSHEADRVTVTRSDPREMIDP